MKRCPSCQSPVLPGETICLECGTELVLAASVPAPSDANRGPDARPSHAVVSTSEAREVARVDAAPCPECGEMVAADLNGLCPVCGADLPPEHPGMDGAGGVEDDGRLDSGTAPSAPSEANVLPRVDDDDAMIAAIAALPRGAGFDAFAAGVAGGVAPSPTADAHAPPTQPTRLPSASTQPVPTQPMPTQPTPTQPTPTQPASTPGARTPAPLPADRVRARYRTGPASAVVAAQERLTLRVEGGQKVFFDGAMTDRIPFDVDELQIGRRDPASGHYPEIDLTHYRDLDPHLSRRHARLLRVSGRLYVEDLCANDATWVNDRSHVVNADRVEIRPGDRVIISDSVALLLVFEPGGGG